MEQVADGPDPPALARRRCRRRGRGGPPDARPALIAGASRSATHDVAGPGGSAARRVRGLASSAFPLHPAGQPSDVRVKHLADVKVPMLFLQGTRDTLADLGVLRPVVAGLGKRATPAPIDEADHSFTFRPGSGRKDPDVRREMLDAFAAWADKVAERRPQPVCARVLLECASRQSAIAFCAVLVCRRRARAREKRSQTAALRRSARAG